MVDKPLVSIITPCYNGASYLDGYFETIVCQTYPRIELIFVDDGSTDQTLKLAESWRDRLESHSIVYKLLHQPNGGQAKAINLALPYVEGDYITWPDSDDLMAPNNIESKVSYLEEHPEKGLVTCDIALVNESDPTVVVGKSVCNDSRARIFEGFLYGQNGYFCSGIAYLVRASALFDSIGGRRIYESRSGQNWQLLLPLTYRFDCGFIHETLATYVVRATSHSRSYVCLEDKIRRTFELEDILVHVLSTMEINPNDYEKYMQYVRGKYLPDRFSLQVKMGNRQGVLEIKKRLDETTGHSVKRTILMIICLLGLGPICYRLSQTMKVHYRNIRLVLSRER